MSLVIKSEISIFEKELKVAFESKEAKVKLKKKVDGEEKEVDKKYAIYNTSVIWDDKKKKQTTVQWVRNSEDDKSKTNTFSILPGYELKITKIPGLDIHLDKPIKLKFNRLSLTGKDKEGRFFPLPPPKDKDKNKGTTAPPKDQGKGTQTKDQAKKDDPQKDGIPFTRFDYDVEIEVWGYKQQFRRSKIEADKKKKQKAETTQKPAGSSKAPAPSESPKPSNTTIAADGTSWVNINKSASGIHLKAIGFTWADNRICILLSASVTLMGLKFAVQGLTAKVRPSTMFSEAPEFDIQGLELGYYSEKISFGAALLKQTLKVNNKEMTQFLGAALLELKSMKLMVYGVGAYGKIENEDSLFMYFGLNYPIGGPPFFFVQGLAIGLGYNRRLELPFEKLEKFPLVKLAFGAAEVKEEGLLGLVQDLSPFIPPSPGDIFFMAGVRFDTFKIVQSFALIVLKLSGKFKLNIYGISRLSLGAPGQKPKIFIEIKLQGDINPQEGYVKIDGAITNRSYILTEKARLSGGFAFYAWWGGEHAGDFVFSVGGYHPRFRRPDHYPALERVSLDWQVSDNFKIYGKVYFALTPKVVMAGLIVGAWFKSKYVKATFNAGMHFLIQWEPFYYDFELYVEMKLQIHIRLDFGWLGSVNKYFNLAAGARLEISGPEFSVKGRAYLRIDLGIKTIEFSAKINVGSGKAKPQPLSWEAFSNRMLPDPKDRFQFSILEGLADRVKAEKDTETDTLILHPKDIVFELQSVIPINSFSYNEKAINASEVLYNGKVEQAPTSPTYHAALMEKDKSSIKNSKLLVSLETSSDGQTWGKASGNKHNIFDQQVISKKLPASLWGDPAQSADLNADPLIKVLSGLRLSLAKQPSEGNTTPLKKGNLLYEQDRIPKHQEKLPTLDEEALKALLGLDMKQATDDSFYEKSIADASYQLA